MKKVNINVLGNNFWYVPNIFTISKRKWVQRPYTNFQKLLKNEELFYKDFLLSLNGDKDFKYFRIVQNIQNINLFLNKKELEKIETIGVVEHKIPKTKVIIAFDKKSIKLIKNGIIPYYSKKFLKENYINKKIIWRRFGWKEI